MDGLHFFGEGSAWNFLNSETQKMRVEIDGMAKNQFLERSDDDLADYFAGIYRAVLPTISDGPYDLKETEQEEATMRSVFLARYPYTGNGIFFRYSGPQSPMLYRDAKISNVDVVIRYVVSMNDPAVIGRETEGDVSQLRDGLQQMVLWVKNYNDNLRGHALDFILK